MRKEVAVVAVAAIAISVVILAFYAYSTANRKDTVASVDLGTKNSIAQNVTMIPPSDQVTLQVLDNNGSSTIPEGHILSIHITHVLNLSKAKMGYLAIFPIIPTWPYNTSGQEKQYFSLQDEDGKDVSGKVFFYREGVYGPTAICKPKSESQTGATSTQIEAMIGFPMNIPVASQQNSLKGEHLLYARYNIFGLGPSDDGSSVPSTSSNSTTQNAESKAMSSRYNLTFSSFNDVKIELPTDAKIVSTEHLTCVTASDNASFPAWNINFYTVVFDIEHK